jgi:hypothetical protein
MHAKSVKRLRRRLMGSPLNKHGYTIDGDTALVHLPSGGPAIIDARDVDLLEQRTWYRAGYKKSYVCSGRSRMEDGKRRYSSVYLHRAVWEQHNGKIPNGMEIDHIDGNPLDNRLSNLRLATKSQNKANTKKFNRKEDSIHSTEYKEYAIKAREDQPLLRLLSAQPFSTTYGP